LGEGHAMLVAADCAIKDIGDGQLALFEFARSLERNSIDDFVQTIAVVESTFVEQKSLWNTSRSSTELP